MYYIDIIEEIFISFVVFVCLFVLFIYNYYKKIVNNK